MRDFIYEIKRFLYKEYIPVTKSILLLSGIIFILSFIYRPLTGLLLLSPVRVVWLPWTLLTYPLVNFGFISLVFAALWLWFVGGSLERSWGSFTYLVFLLLVTLATGLLMALVGGAFLGGGFAIYGLWLPLVGLTWAWASLHPDWEVMFWGLIPIKAKFLAWIMVGGTFYDYFRRTGNLFLGLAAVSGIAVVYLFSGGGPFSRGIRYWAWQRGFSFQGFKEELKKKFKKNRLKVVK